MCQFSEDEGRAWAGIELRERERAEAEQRKKDERNARRRAARMNKRSE